MEMHSRQSLYEIHGIIAPQRRRTRWGKIARRAVTWLLAVFKSAKLAIAAELAARRGIEELAGMNDHMLRDLGITRSEIESRARLPRTSVGMDDTSIFPDDLAQCLPDLPTVSSPGIVEERPEQQLRRLHSPSRQ
ncbi:DUF1127 domain-containing protein [Bradyrhizobium iriomotense]|uniref:YjiS-like domain-containing protein n=1 Tax=Bradyrhizobium iriomotense TaxID=441950 RepID=A0ABQ6B5L0_9BRAD|nr:DUF1127 domain-containing protein [Bradyrhizobium iriomotense]GLR89126.1 hypothetical protein GCM10007857_58390 [Bradyrhizobium iriomotense]